MISRTCFPPLLRLVGESSAPPPSPVFSALFPASQMAHSEAAQGSKFAAFIFSSFGRPVATPSLGPGSFSLLVAFGRCRFRLDEVFVAQSLCDILGGPADSLNVVLVEERIFLFSVSCK